MGLSDFGVEYPFKQINKINKEIIKIHPIQVTAAELSKKD